MSFFETVSLAFPFMFLILFLVSLLASAVGFKKYLYFISIGYGLSVAAIAVALLIACIPKISVMTVIQLLLLMAYGIRLGGFLLAREVKSGSYRAALKDAYTQKIAFSIKIVTWIACAFLYCSQTSPALYRTIADQNGYSAPVSPWQIAGVLIMALSILLESMADYQKSKAKAQNPSRFCDSGLYKVVRYPNYLAEILFWTGVFVSGFDIYQGGAQWTVSLFGYGCIFYIMLNSTHRMEAKHTTRYGTDEEYKRYIAKTPQLIPFLPIKK